MTDIQPVDYGDLQARADRATELEAVNSELTREVRKFEAEKARDKLVTEITDTYPNIPASALRGDTREELQAHAQQLVELFKPSGPVIPGQEKMPPHRNRTRTSEFLNDLFGQ